jgi:hypothetical protein
LGKKYEKGMNKRWKMLNKKEERGNKRKAGVKGENGK